MRGSHKKRAAWEKWVYLGFFIPLTALWVAAKIWPQSVFHTWERFFYERVESRVFIVLLLLSPIYFVIALVRTAREKAAEDRERFRLARGE